MTLEISFPPFDTCALRLSSLSSFLSCRLFVLDDTDLGGAQRSAVELEALLLDEEDGVVLLVGLGGHEGGIMLIRIELFARGV